MSRIMVLPGTKWQIPIMKKVKEMGHILYVANPKKEAEVMELADFFLKSDIFSFAAIIPYCQEQGIDAVISDECDIATDAVAKINRAIGADALSKEMAELFTNKYMMRRFCEKKQLNPIPYRLCRKREEAVSFFKESGQKVIMKPLDSNASHGVFTITSQDEIHENFAQAHHFSRNEKGVLLEKYIEGTEFTVDGIMTGNGHISMAISEKSHYRHNENIANSLLFTHHSERFDYDLLRAVNDRLINTTGLPYGLTHVEYKYHNGVYYLIEMAARGGGNLISAVIAPFMSGIDSYGYLINRAIDKNYDSPLVIDYRNGKCALLKFLDFPVSEGKVVGIHGEDYLRDDRRIKSYGLNFQIGDQIHKPENDSVRLGYYIICTENMAELNEVTAKISEKVKIVIE